MSKKVADGSKIHGKKCKQDGKNIPELFQLSTKPCGHVAILEQETIICKGEYVSN